MEKMHLDTDLGGDTDDLCALAMLLKWPNIQITGITTNTELNGKRAGLHASYVSRLERDVIRRRPSPLHILSIADTLGIDIADLLGHDPFQPFQQPLESIQGMKGMIVRERVESLQALGAEIGNLTAEVRMLREAFVQAGIKIPKVEAGVEKATPHRTTRLRLGTQRGQIL